MGRTRKGEATVRRIALFFFVSLFIVEVAYSFDNEESHRMITDKAISASTLSLYLQNTIGLKDGASSIIKDNKTVSWWLSEGSYLEDLPPCRASNHFHNPLLPWSESYMSDDTTSLGLAIRVYCGSTGWPYADRKSAVIWAKGNGMGWSNARTYFYTALTSESNTDRETNFAKTFQALGQVIHLLQDMAVPSHVRNDFTSHLVFGGINSTNYNDVSKWYIQPFEFYIKNKPYLITSASSAVSLARLTDYWDTDQYTKNTNPSILTNPGLAEYANSNFLSEETIFKGILDSAHSFPYPAWSSVMEYDEVIDPAKGTVRTYLKKTKDGETVNHLAAGKWFYKYLPSFLKNSGLKLDEQVHADYASLLLPRAVGYSAGLLNYFFRGEIDMFEDMETDAGYVIENNSDEDMSGTFELWYDNKSGERLKVSNANWTLSINKKSSGSNKSTNIVFNSPTDIKEKGKYILVFRGKMGRKDDAGNIVGEEGAVVGRRVELKGLTYVLLANIDYKVLPLRIKIMDGQYNLMPETKNLNIQVEYWSPSSYNLTMQSYADNTKHRVHYTTPGYSACFRWSSELKEYGVFQPYSYGCHYGAFVGGYGTLYEKDGKYRLYAYGRHGGDSILQDSTLGCSYDYVYRYYTPPSINYEVVATDQMGEGGTVGIPGQGWTACSGPSISNKIIAALGNKKAMIINTEIKRGDPELIGTKILWTSPVGDVRIKGETYNDDRTSVLKLTIGEQVIDSAYGGTERKYPHIYVSTDSNDWRYINGILSQYYPGGTYSFYYSYESANGDLTVLDYDNLYGDDMFIVLYTKTQTIQKYEGDTVITVPRGWGALIYDNSGINQTYDEYKREIQMAYKIPALGIQKIVLYTISNNDSAIYTDIIGGVSSQMNKDMMVYTYIVKKWDGTKYVFDKRVVGIINISDTRMPIGYRQEFIINNESFPVTNMDYSQLAAIGIHIAQ